MVKLYYKEEFNNETWKEGDRINYSGRVFDEEELVNLVDSSLDFWLTSGRYVDKFEKSLCDYLNIKYCATTTSGSSANLLAFMALTSPKLKERQVQKGDEVITVAAGFPTTVSPIIQYGAIPVFVDVDIPTYNIKIDDLEKALSPKTKCVIIAHTLGNPFNIKAVSDFCKKHNLWLIEDNCDSLGAKYLYENDYKFTGTFGDLSTSSFYPPHHITTGEGGAVFTSNPQLYKIVKSFRDWGRDCYCDSGRDNTCKNRFNMQFYKLPFGYDHKYVYSHFGYNLKMTEMQASIGVAQIKKLNDFKSKRIENFNKLKEKMSHLQDYFILPQITQDSIPSPFGFMLTIKDKKINRRDLLQYLENKNIQTRLLFAGNITKQPLFETLKENIDYRIIGDLENTDIIMNDSFWIGVYPKINDDMINYMVKCIEDFIEITKN
ncbi:MAG: lipopolysaccharide biosynthesis protein RfbH [Romboutsia sp.]|nr:lipopolysaccharide biosynthesis protein RfbH [Romboutsia sp.]